MRPRAGKPVYIVGDGLGKRAYLPTATLIWRNANATLCQLSVGAITLGENKYQHHHVFIMLGIMVLVVRPPLIDRVAPYVCLLDYDWSQNLAAGGGREERCNVLKYHAAIYGS